MRLGATSTESSYSAPKRLAAPVSTSIKKPNLLAQAYNALLNIPGPQISSPVNTGRGVSIGGQQGAMQVTVEPLRQAGRRAVGDLTAIPGIGRPSPSPTAADVRRGNYVGPVADYLTLATTVLPAATKATRFALSTKGEPGLPIAKQIIDEIPNTKPLLNTETKPRVRTPVHELLINDKSYKADIGGEFPEPLGMVELWTKNPTTGQVNGYTAINFTQSGEPAQLSHLYSKSPSAATQLIAAAEKIAREKLPYKQFPIVPAQDLSRHSYPLVERLMKAGLIDPNYELPDISWLNQISLKDVDKLLREYKPLSYDKPLAIDSSFYIDDYNKLLSALANAQKLRTQRLSTSRQIAKQMLQNPELRD